MIGTTVLHNRILNKFGEGRSRRYLSRPWRGSLLPASIKTLPDVLARVTEQFARIKRLMGFWLLVIMRRR